ncbi:hypothetical protein F66182_8887 [Fusarium sp. NRRL 66182]|nr:hypothetical protein F66182_8887 [Fusarium sp. NRRL 66182]
MSSIDSSAVPFRSLCVLCAVPFQTGDEVVDVADDTEPSRSGTYELCKTVLKRKRPASASDQGDKFDFFFPSWDDIDVLRTTASHLDCSQFLSRKNISSLCVSQILHCDFFPAYSVAAQRRRALNEVAAGARFFQLQRIPLEIAHHIVEQCLSWITISYAVSIPEYLVSQTTTYCIDTRKQICARFISFQQRTYINHLSDAPSAEGLWLNVAQPNRRNNTIYLGHDDLGIRRIIITNEKDSRPLMIQEQLGLWWETIILAQDDHTLCIESDMRTNKGRIWTIGPAQAPDRTDRIIVWKFVDRPRQEASTIYYEDAWRRIQQMAFETEQPLDHGIQPPVHIPRPEQPAHKWREGFFYSSASLAGICSVALCRGTMGDDECVIGLVLDYRDGRQRTLGQVRLDYLANPIQVGDSSGIAMRLCLKRSRVFEVKVGDAEDGWMWMPWEGKIIWWFSIIATKVFHEMS